MPAVLLRILGGAAAAATLSAQAATITSVDLARPDGNRHFLMATPDQAATGKRPLVIVLHGHAGSARQVFGKEYINAPMQVWLEVADRDNVLVIAPDGARGSDEKRGWNDCRGDASTNPHTDDVGFIGAIIDKAIAEHSADPSRVYVMGTSNGGGMVLRLAAEMAPRLAGAAAIAATWPAKSLCAAPQLPVPLLLVHGTADKIAPFGGGEVGHFLLRGRGSAISAVDTVALWRAAAKLPPSSVDTVFLHRDAGDHTRATRYVWGLDPHQVQVEFIKVENGGHSEPSIRRRMQWVVTALVGAQNGDVETVEEAWSFFKDKRASTAP
ncbi:MAG: PHB depolymerase family esterase [Pseudomonadota bacterium]